MHISKIALMVCALFTLSFSGCVGNGNDAFRKWLSGDKESRPAKLSFEGQGRKVELATPEVIDAFSDALAIRLSGPPKLGISYRLKLYFKGGESVSTYVYLHEDGGGFALADPVDKQGGDNSIRSYTFTEGGKAAVFALYSILSVNPTGQQVNDTSQPKHGEDQRAK